MVQAVLTLNAGMVPVGTCGIKEAISAIYQEIARPVAGTQRYWRSPSTKIEVPSVIRFCDLTIIPPKRIVYSPLNLIYRDSCKCGYCGKQLSVEELEIDHVIPRSKFERIAKERGLKYPVTGWHNCISSCVPCNRRKADLLPEQANMFPLWVPKEPKFRPHVTISKALAIKKQWYEWLEPFEKFTVLFVGD